MAIKLPVSKIVDVHTHFFSPELFRLCERVLGTPDKNAPFVKIKPSKNHMQQLEPGDLVNRMDELGFTKAFCSFPSMPVYMGEGQEVKRPEERKQISQYLNDYFAEVHNKYPERLFFFADVPLSVDVDFSCRELHRAIKELGLPGVAIPTNINGRRPSQPEFEEFFAEAEKIGVPILIHPQNAYGKENLQKYMLTAVIGYPAETALTAAYMIFDGFLEKHPDIKIILSHLGGFIPYLYRRLNVFTEVSAVDPVLTGRVNLKKQPSEYLDRFYYDSAVGNTEALELCVKLFGIERILFGTDYPYLENAEIKTVDYINRAKLSEQERKQLFHLNAEKLFDI